MVLADTADFVGSIQQGALQLWQSWLNAICSISIVTTSDSNISCWFPELSGSYAGWEFALLRTGDVNGEVTNYHVVLFDALLCRYDFHVANCTAETLAIKSVVKLGWVFAGAVCVQMCVPIFGPGVADAETNGYREFQNSLTFLFTVPKLCPPWVPLNTLTGKHCLTDDQLEKENPARDALDFNNLGCPICL